MKWAFTDPEKYTELPNKNKVNIDSFKYYIELFSSSVWISNSSIERLIPYKPKGIIYINTWHGIPMKHLGPDEKETTSIVRNWFAKVNFNLLTASGTYDQKIFKHIFPSTSNIQITGLPRNLYLKMITSKQCDFIRERVIQKYRLDPSKKILLYAPTFREYELDSDDHAFSTDSLLKLSSKYNLLFRSHYYAEDKGVMKKCIDVSDDPDLNHLLISADLLVSDYSSVIFDYSLLKKPVVLYCYDMDRYLQYRGVYVRPDDLNVPFVKTEKDLLETLLSDSYLKMDLTDFYAKFNGVFDTGLNTVKRTILFGSSK